MIALLIILLVSSSTFAGMSNCPDQYPNGRTLRYSNGSMDYPNGRTLLYSSGSMDYPDGRTLRYSNGSMDYPSGRTLRYSNGSADYPNGRTLRYSTGAIDYPNGTTMCSSGGNCEVPLNIPVDANTNFAVRIRSNGNNDYRLSINSPGLNFTLSFDNAGNVTCRVNGTGGGGHGGGGGGNQPTPGFIVQKAAATVRVDMNPGYDPEKVRQAIERALDSLK